MNGSGKSDRAGRPKGRNRIHAVEWARAEGAEADVLAAMERTLARRRRRGAIAGMAVLTAVVLAVALRPGPEARQGYPASGAPVTIVVAAPERRVLEDGSTIELRRGAQVSVDYGRTARRIVLRDGEAHFQVTKDATRPFVVLAAGVEVRAVGTAFAVRRDAGAVSLIVTEGRVAVATPAGKRTEAAELGAGDGIEIPTAAAALPTKVLLETEIQERLQWRIPTLEFTGTPLAKAIAAINAHASARLVLADPTLESVRLSGRLRGDNVGALLRLLEDEHRVQVAPGAGGELRLFRAR